MPQFKSPTAPTFVPSDLSTSTFTNLMTVVDVRDAPIISTEQPGQDFWGNDALSWDSFVLGGQRLPGKAKVKVKLGHRRDTKASPGKSGQTATSLGRATAKIIIELELWTPGDYHSWLQWAQLLMPTNAAPVSWDAFHPALAMYGINKIDVTEVDGPDDTGTPQVKKITLTCEEFAKSTSGVTTNKDSKLLYQDRPEKNMAVAQERLERQKAREKVSANLSPPPPRP